MSWEGTETFLIGSDKSNHLMLKSRLKVGKGGGLSSCHVHKLCRKLFLSNSRMPILTRLVMGWRKNGNYEKRRLHKHEVSVHRLHLRNDLSR